MTRGAPTRVRAARRRGDPVGLAALVVLLAALSLPVRAAAAIHPAAVVDGPTNDILEVDGAAMAPDGTGGIVYRKQVGGVAHVFAAPFAGGHWGPPAEVDAGDLFGASQPAIAAGDGGRLLVVWVQARSVNAVGVPQYELMSATLQPGASGFGQVILVDPNVGNVETGDISAVQPRLAMAPDGVAYVVYRVTTNECFESTVSATSGFCPQGNSTDKLVDVRVARYDYLLWNTLGAVNRASQVPMRNPTVANAPAIGIDDLSNNGVVVWQEPEVGEGPARIYLRRLFSAVQGNVLQASPSAIGGRPVTSDADSPVVAVGPYGQTSIAYRVLGAPGSAVATTQLFLNSLPSSFDPHGGQLGEAVPIPGATQGGVGQPSAAIDNRGAFRVAWTQGGAVQELGGEERSLESPVRIGASGGQVFTSIDPAGGGTTAWSASAGGLPVVGVREDYSQGAFQTASLAGNLAGPVEGLSLGSDGQGDVLLGWTQGPPGDSEVVGDFIQAPPAPFDVDTPSGWVRGPDVKISWEGAPDAVPGVTYSVYVDGRVREAGLTGLSMTLDAFALGDGVHQVQVLAGDSANQQTMSSEAELKIGVDAPILRIAFVDDRRGVRVRVSDRASGVDAGATRISFGDGRYVDRRLSVTHVYRRPGAYWVTAFVRDRAGNGATDHLRVRVR